eukprot:c6564_g1_i2.p1 GENE.c6564_g1_i2~~c6564_g1_i2.p1  ORF type:complete len:250 (+),score=51.80 c6564_g1_i2:113-751(+)
MADAMIALCEIDGVLSDLERELLAISHKNLTSQLRTCLKSLASCHDDEIGDFRDNFAEYRQSVASQLHNVCNRLLQTIQSKLLPAARDPIETIFYTKLFADYNRYIAESSSGDQHDTSTNAAREAFRSATELATKHLPITHPLRLGLVLNYSVFLFEIEHSKQTAVDLARSVFDQAINKLETIPEHQYRESTLVLQVIRDNLATWTLGIETD